MKPSGPHFVPAGGKGSYRELCKTDFKRAAWLAGRAAAGKTNADPQPEKQANADGNSVSTSKKKGKKKWTKRGKRGGKKNRKRPPTDGRSSGPPAQKRYKFGHHKKF